MDQGQYYALAPHSNTTTIPQGHFAYQDEGQTEVTGDFKSPILIVDDRIAAPQSEQQDSGGDKPTEILDVTDTNIFEPHIDDRSTGLPVLPPPLDTTVEANSEAFVDDLFSSDAVAKNGNQEMHTKEDLPIPTSEPGPEFLDQQMPMTHAEVITQMDPIMQPDFDIDDEAYAASVSTSYVTSIASEVSRGILENERLYPQYGQHSYGMPVDEEEMDRMDMQHRKYEMVIGDRHFLAPIGDSPRKILDLATGTGIWALEIADMFPAAQVIGVDIAPIQPRWVAPNCHFEIDDIEDSWTYRRNEFDFVHLRDPLFVVRDWPKLCQQAFEHIKPGGWCELACIYPRVMCDDGSMPPDSGFKLVCDKLVEASELFGATAECVTSFSKYLRNAGFVDVTVHIFKVPSSPWPKDKRLKKIGALEMANVIAGATAFGLRAFEQVFGWSKIQTEVAMVDFRRDVKNRNYHQYCQYWVVYGRRPLDFL